ncbi:uncharacterized protein LOC133903582 [Phragmites australis]|uniref:uncharacterized protein LOC133903582 n=1 Tax=Phragmites australis TaxID=29695 RepID=UPI002D76DF81|nr:uncharacterized protein LOC133903582 [Phragmites australis]
MAIRPGCWVPWTTMKNMHYIGYSYGNLIYGHENTLPQKSGTRVERPQLIIDKYDDPVFGSLTAPLASPDSSFKLDPTYSSRIYQAVRLALSSEPKWVKAARLDNLSVFVGTETNSQAFAWKNPERWGGRSNCVYFWGVHEPW